VALVSETSNSVWTVKERCPLFMVNWEKNIYPSVRSVLEVAMVNCMLSTGTSYISARGRIETFSNASRL